MLRTIVWLALVVWLGGLLFFPITAWASFSSIADTHTAGTVVAKCLRMLHYEGFAAGAVIVLLLAIGWPLRVFRKSGPPAILVTVIMLGFTAFSQFRIIPQMEKDRIAAGGAIDSVPSSDPRHADFDRLHHDSEHLEEAVMLSGFVLLFLLARDY